MYYLYAVNKKKLVCHDKAEYETYGLVCIGIIHIKYTSSFN